MPCQHALLTSAVCCCIFLFTRASGGIILSSLLIKEGNMEKAIPYLEKLTLSKNNFQKQASNILALNYLKQGNMEMANFYKKLGSSNRNFQNVLKRSSGISN